MPTLDQGKWDISFKSFDKLMWPDFLLSCVPFLYLKVNELNLGSEY